MAGGRILKRGDHEATGDVVRGGGVAGVHGAATLRVRVQDHGDGRTRAGGRGVTTFEAAFGAGENDGGHGRASQYGSARALAPSAAPAGRGTEAPLVAGDLKTSAAALYAAMRDALRRGDWAAFGRAFDALGRVLGPQHAP